ncbi:MAG: DUF4093 domain-containing protein [Clostridia bacterium]|nr:DUF4093 domain-containing protein [Clostridia bacterium]
MSEKLYIDVPIIVEGKYDRIKLDSILDAHIIVTDGFGIFKRDEQRALLRRLAQKNGVIVLTDSDGGGLVIRSHLRSVLPPDKIINLYIPEVKGKEKRKKTGGKAGLLGVEGIDADILRELFRPYSNKKRPEARGNVTKADFFADGLSGKENSTELRKKLALSLKLPANMSANALLEAVNLCCSREEYEESIRKIKER